MSLPTNRWIVIFPWGDVLPLASNYANKEEALVHSSKGTKARRLSKDAYHEYADAEFTEQLRRQKEIL